MESCSTVWQELKDARSNTNSIYGYFVIACFFTFLKEILMIQ